MAKKKFYILPRNRILRLNAFEFGWLSAILLDGTWKERMEKECPIMFFQFQKLFVEAYIDPGHPFNKQAIKESKKYKKELKKLLKKYKEDYSWINDTDKPDDYGWFTRNGQTLRYNEKGQIEIK